jgi:hypothetical protein
MRFAPSVSVFMFATSLGTTVACSDGVSEPSPAKYTPPDAAVTVPPLPPARAPITVIVKGHGHVVADDGSFDCEESGEPDGGTCHPAHGGVLLYAAAYLPWAFDHWEPSFSTDSSFQLESWTADPLTAVFVPLPLDGSVPLSPVDAAGD